MNSQWCDYILVLTVLTQVVAESGEDAALGLVRDKFGMWSTSGVQSAVPHLLSHTVMQQLPASRFCSVPEATEVFTAPLVQPLGFKRTTAGIYAWAAVQWHLLLPFLFSLLLYDPQMCASKGRPPIKQQSK